MLKWRQRALLKSADAQVYGDGSYEAIYKGALHFTDMVVVADENVNTEIVILLDPKISGF